MLRPVFRIQRQLAVLKLLWDSKNPVSFGQKIQFKSAHDRRPILTIFADKILSKNYIESIVGNRFLPKVYAIGNKPEDINWNLIPREFVFKVNHGSKGVVVVTHEADKNNVLPKNLENEKWSLYRIHPDSLDRTDLLKLGKHWLGLDYYWFKGVRPHA